MSDWLRLAEFAQNPAQVRYSKALSDGLSFSQVAEEFGVNQRSVERSMAALRKSAERQGYAPERDQFHAVPNTQSVSGVSTLYDDEGNVKLQWVKSRTDTTADSSEALREFMDGFTEPYKGKSKPVKSPKNTLENLLTFYALGDPHFGMRAWGVETGGDNFDTDIAERELKAALSVLVDTVPSSEIGFLCNLGDLFHADGLKPLTPESGHLLDTDGRLSHTIDAAGRAFRFAIDLMLKKHKKVILANVRGNHDPTMGLFFNKLMEAFYSNDDRVEVLPNENKFMTYEWGKVGLFIHHSDKLNNARAYEAITRKFSEIWGRTKFRHYHKGHIHHHTVEERGGLLMESHNTLAAEDAWHSASGYGAARSATAITYDREYGEVHRSRCGIDLARSALTDL